MSFKSDGGKDYKVFNKLFDILVQPFLFDGTAGWGTRLSSCINAVQNLEARFRLAVGSTTPSLAFYGEVGF